jgi:hypothetical protein
MHGACALLRSWHLRADLPAKPWLESTVIPRETVLDLAVLSSIEQLVLGLHNTKLSQALSSALAKSLSTLELPTEVHVKLDKLPVG